MQSSCPALTYKVGGVTGEDATEEVVTEEGVTEGVEGVRVTAEGVTEEGRR